MGNRPFKLRPGQSLMEVVIAALIAAITTVAVFSVALSSSVSQRRTDKKEQMAMVLDQAHSTLQTFVSADPVSPAGGGGYYAPTAGGAWPADTRSSQMSPDSWALAPGTHDISSLMNTPENIELRRDLKTNQVHTCVNNGSCFLVYDVTDDPNCLVPGGSTFQACKTVRFRMKYVD